MTDVKCNACGHVRETTEANPTLVCCVQCGSTRIDYVNRTEGCHL